eukprot:scpid90309/ scgid19271/ 
MDEDLVSWEVSDEEYDELCCSLVPDAPEKNCDTDTTSNEFDELCCSLVQDVEDEEFDELCCSLVPDADDNADADDDADGAKDDNNHNSVPDESSSSTNDNASTRFALVSDEQVSAMAKSSVPKNTRKKWPGPFQFGTSGDHQGIQHSIQTKK